MTLLRFLRNLAVLTILTVGVLSLTPRTVAAQSSCQYIGGACNSNAQCCLHYCSPVTRHCCAPWHNRACSNDNECCSGLCRGFRCL